jgi:hypothetical protein
MGLLHCKRSKKNIIKVSRDIPDQSRSKVLSLVASDCALGELLGEVSGKETMLSLVQSLLVSAMTARTEVQHLTSVLSVVANQCGVCT